MRTLFIAAIILLSEVLKKKFKWDEENTRKIVHIGVGLAAALAPLFFSTPILLILFAIVFGFFDYISVRLGLFKGIHGNRFSYGTVFFPIAYLVLIIVFCIIGQILFARV